jgi:hypothetical protein
MFIIEFNHCLGRIPYLGEGISRQPSLNWQGLFVGSNSISDVFLNLNRGLLAHLLRINAFKTQQQASSSCVNISQITMYYESCLFLRQVQIPLIEIPNIPNCLDGQ